MLCLFRQIHAIVVMIEIKRFILHRKIKKENIFCISWDSGTYGHDFGNLIILSAKRFQRVSPSLIFKK